MALLEDKLLSFSLLKEGDDDDVRHEDPCVVQNSHSRVFQIGRWASTSAHTLRMCMQGRRRAR